MSNNKTLSKELEDLYQEIQDKVEGSPFSKRIASKFAPVEKIIVFIFKVVKEVERVEEENLFLKDELDKINQELVLHEDRLKKIENNE